MKSKGTGGGRGSPRGRSGARGIATRKGPAGGGSWPELRPPPSEDPLQPLPVASLRWTCPPLTPSPQMPSVATMLGQGRAMTALRLGLELYAPGYNIVVSGIVGAGRLRIVQSLLEELRPLCRPSPDRVYVNNLLEPNRPRLITLPRGKALQFRTDVEDLFLRIQDALVAALRSRPHKVSRRLVVKAAEERDRRLMEALSREAKRAGCSVVHFQGQGGGLSADIYPVFDGEAITVEALSALAGQGRLTAAERDALLARREELLERLAEVAERGRENARRTERDLRAMDRQVAANVLATWFGEFEQTWPQPEVGAFLADVRQHVERDLARWVAASDDPELPPLPASHESPPSTGDEGSVLLPMPRPVRTRFQELAVHVIKYHASEDCPVVVETNPTYTNLFGTIEPAREDGHVGVGAIHAGALLRADGGYLVLRLADVLTEPGVWSQLKRALKSGLLEIREYDPGSGSTTGALQPEAIPIDVKVLLIAEPGIYDGLAHEDPQFPQVFKVHAEFDTTVPVSEENLRRYADFIGWLARSEGLLPFSPDAAAAVAEYGARLAGRRDRLTTSFGELSDVIREASHAARREGPGPVGRPHVEAAGGARQQRHDLPRELVEREFRDGYLLLPTEGFAIGQINAMTVLDTGTLAFGKPCRITAASSPGTRSASGLMNIEREVALSGPLHDKGVMILHGYLLDQFGQEGPICLQATLCFEQLYGGVEGDSASSAELYALLSSLARVPLDQALAVTGSVNQKGEVQAISAVNEKIEGFFRLCRQRGLTGRQGVVIPRANVPDLMLDAEVLGAAAAGTFRIHAVAYIGEGIRLLTGIGEHEVFERVRATLARFRELGLGR
jgi:predicted ATP-dependent protease